MAIPSSTVTVGDSNQLTIEVDMPNPRLTPSVLCSEGGIFDRYGVCRVTIFNQSYEKEMISQDTIVVLLVYIGNDRVDQEVLAFGNVMPGGAVTRTSREMLGFQFGVQETVIVVVLEGWKYTPEFEPTTVGLPIGLIENAVNDAIGVCRSNFVECVKVIASIAFRFV